MRLLASLMHACGHHRFSAIAREIRGSPCLVTNHAKPLAAQRQLDDSLLKCRQTTGGKSLQAKPPEQAAKLHCSARGQYHDDFEFWFRAYDYG